MEPFKMQNAKNCNKGREGGTQGGGWGRNILGATLGGELNLQVGPQTGLGSSFRGAGTDRATYRNTTGHSKRSLILGAYYVPSIL